MLLATGSVPFSTSVVVVLLLSVSTGPSTSLPAGSLLSFVAFSNCCGSESDLSSANAGGGLFFFFLIGFSLFCSSVFAPFLSESFVAAIVLLLASSAWIGSTSFVGSGPPATVGFTSSIC